eukprot:s165_g22.t1
MIPHGKVQPKVFGWFGLTGYDWTFKRTSFLHLPTASNDAAWLLQLTAARHTRYAFLSFATLKMIEHVPIKSWA